MQDVRVRRPAARLPPLRRPAVERTFRTHCAAHNVRLRTTDTEQLHNPVVGDLTLSFNRLGLATSDGLSPFAYTAEPGSRSAEALRLLGTWPASNDLDASSRSSASLGAAPPGGS